MYGRIAKVQPLPIVPGQPPITFGTGLTGILGEAIFLGKGWNSTQVNVGVTPTLILDCPRTWPYMISNPSGMVGQVPTTTGILTSQVAVAANGNIQATPLLLSNFLELHLWLDVTANTGTFTFIEQARDPASGNWADVQNLWSAINTTGTFYAFPAMLGVATSFAVRWIVDVAGAATFTIGYALKQAVSGVSTAGISQVVFIGPNEGISVNSGFRLNEGRKEMFVVEQGAQVWGIGQTTVSIDLFRL